jgi:hypothetical protein
MSPTPRNAPKSAANSTLRRHGGGTRAPRRINPSAAGCGDHASQLYEPRLLQQAIHADRSRFKVLACHRRFGKTVMGVNELIDRAARPDRADARYAYIAPTYRQAKRVAWDYLKRYAHEVGSGTIAAPPGAARGKGPKFRTHETELRLDFRNGSRIQLYGADRPDSLRGIYLDGVVFDEYGLMRPQVWSEVVRPMLVDREGFAVFIGTPKGRNAFFDLYERAKDEVGWFRALHRASETGFVPLKELDAARRDMTKEEYEQEFECSFSAAIAGAYFAREIAEAEADGRVRPIPHDPRYPVYTAWDLGYNDPTAIWFIQVVGSEVRWIDYYENRGEGLDHYARTVNARRYSYALHFLPHDVGNHEIGSGRPRLELLQNHGLKVKVVDRGNLDDGIEALRQLIRRSCFDALRCKDGLNALRNYRSEWNERRGSFTKQPLHDWASHAADAARQFAMGHDGRPPLSRSSQEESADGHYDIMHY